MPKIFFEGREYDSPEQMTPEARARYDKAARMLPDRDSNGIPDLLEIEGSSAVPPPPVKPVVSAAQPVDRIPGEVEAVAVPQARLPGPTAGVAAGAASKKRNWIIGLGIGFTLLCAACFILFIVGIFASIRTSGAYQLAVDTAKNHPTVQVVLGVPVEEGLFVSGSVEENGASGSADLEIPLSGPSQSGTLRVTAYKQENTWRLTYLVLEAGGQAYPLVP